MKRILSYNPLRLLKEECNKAANQPSSFFLPSSCVCARLSACVRDSNFRGGQRVNLNMLHMQRERHTKKGH